MTMGKRMLRRRGNEKAATTSFVLATVLFIVFVVVIGGGFHHSTEKQGWQGAFDFVAGAACGWCLSYLGLTGWLRVRRRPSPR